MTATRSLLAVLIVFIAATVCVPSAFAQTPAPPATDASQWFIGAAGALMNPLHGDNETEGRVVLGTFGLDVRRRFRIEAEVTRRAHSSAFIQNDVFLYGGPTGVHGRADQTVLGRETRDWTVGVNALGRAGWHTVSFFAGPGLVYHRADTRLYRTVTNCTPPIPRSGFECDEFDDRSSVSGTGLQLLAGVDLRLHSRVTAFVAGRAEIREDLAMGSVGVMAGVRVVIR